MKVLLDKIALGITDDEVPLGSHLIHFWHTDGEFERGVLSSSRISNELSRRLALGLGRVQGNNAETEGINMSSFSTSRVNTALEDSIPEAGASLESILCTEELQRRPSRPPDYEKENRELVALMSALAIHQAAFFRRWLIRFWISPSVTPLALAC
jgi:hypothetical protein